MCGIAGYYGPETIPSERLGRCIQLMRRRGPDAGGSFIEVADDGMQVYLLHTRLSIIDLDERANQPMAYGPSVMVVNGELYDYIERRRDLQGFGHEFATSSDSEVLLHHIVEHGPEGLANCEGMWALASYDREDHTLLLSRDRFGEKPLYLYSDGAGVYFASEVKALFALMGRRLPVDLDHLCRYMINGYRCLYRSGQGFFTGLREVPAGSFIEIGPDLIERRQRYWTPALNVDPAMDRATAIARTREAVIRSVELRLRADVPLAFCMSGGIDSNSLIGVASQELGHEVHGFTIVNQDARYEEQDMIEHAVKAFGVKHTEIPLNTEGFIDNLRTLIRYHDAPVYTLTYYVSWLLQESIAEHGYKISVSGVGADELFSGYFDHHLAYLHSVRNDAERFAAAVEEWKEHVLPIVRNPFLQDPEYYLVNPGCRDHLLLGAEEFASWFEIPWSEPFVEAHYSDDLLRNRMLNELLTEVVPVILHEDDLNSMYYSIENRSPFLDRQLFDLCAQIPTRHLVHGGRAKSVLREAMRGIVPDAILDNPRKVGFNAPIFDLLDVTDDHTRQALMDDGEIFELVRRDHIEALMSRESLKNSESKFLYYFLNSRIFLEEHA